VLPVAVGASALRRHANSGVTENDARIARVAVRQPHAALIGNSVDYYA
jgi:hypothetical protein